VRFTFEALPKVLPANMEIRYKLDG
jgi:hypothetical protein